MRDKAQRETQHRQEERIVMHENEPGMMDEIRMAMLALG